MPVAVVLERRTKKKQLACYMVNEGLKSQRKRQVLKSAVLHINGEQFLMTVARPLKLSIISHLKGMAMEEMAVAMQSQINLVQSKEYACTHIFLDPQGSFVTLQNKFPGVRVDVTGAGD